MSGVKIKTLEASNDGFGSPIEADWSKSFQEAMQKTEVGGGENNPSDRPDAKELLKQYQQQSHHSSSNHHQQPQQQPQQQQPYQQPQQQHIEQPATTISRRTSCSIDGSTR